MQSLTTAFGLGFLLAIAILQLPFTDASKYRAAIRECEKTLPRDMHCKVVGIVDNPPEHLEK